jgi:phage terminase small subunit
MARPRPLLPPPDEPPKAPEIIAPSWDDGLTAKEAAFVDHYSGMRNATQAYTHAYNTNGTYDTRAKGGREMLDKPHIQRAIKERLKIATDVSGASVGMLLQRFISIATADPRELIGLKIGCCRFCWGEGHAYQWREREYLEQLAEVERLQADARRLNGNPDAIPYPDPAGGLNFNATHPPHPSCPQCHGEGRERFVPRDTDKLSDQALLLYGGVKVKKDGGYEIIIADQSKAAELAGRILGAFNDKLRLSGAIGHMHAITDLRAVDPQEAAKVYRDFVAGHLAA